MLTEPINLGASGRALSLRLWRQENGVTTAAPVEDVEVVDLESGEYTVAGLPDAAAGERYTLVIFDPAEPESALWIYSYGPAPAVAVVWRGEVLVTGATEVKAHDDLQSLALQVASGLPETISAATATFSLWSEADGEVAIAAGAATIVSVVLDGTTETYGCTLAFQLPVGGVGAGTYRGEFQVIFPGGRKMTLPTNDSLRLVVRPDYDGA